jgi:Uncharacterised nucleotidyltransferase
VLAEEELAAVRTLLVPTLLNRIRDAYRDTIILFKGPEVATRYPDASLRSFIDLDLLVPDPEAAHAALLAAGFAEADDPPWAAGGRHRRDVFADKHHTRPLHLRPLPLKIELHRWPNWPRWLTPPSPEELFEGAVPSSVGVAGVMTLAPAAHALALATNAWVDEPLGRIRDLLDVTLIAAEADRTDIAELARRWRLDRLWRATSQAAEASLLHTRRPGFAQRTWGRNVPAARERTVLEAHFENWISSYCTLPVLGATRLAASNVVWELRPAAGESWRAKLRRVSRAAANALAPKSAHDEELGTDARRLSPVTRWREPPGPRR